ncbi:hypothetical protein AURDEDRAFT_137960 [Auricularia subglabra TFB-10046 SS5]|nr:hypothetical protein AURDEDRAFT_137960 [Auricularia subglabra TFB-10046 SS5]
MDASSPKTVHINLLTPQQDGVGIVQTTRHPQFWFNDGNVSLEVENVLFKLHKSLLASTSVMFSDMFVLGDGPNADGEGSDGKPLALPETPLDQFEVLCRAIYAGWGEQPKFSTGDLVQLLAIAHRFQAHAVHARAKDKLDKRSIGVVNRLLYAQRYSIDEWTSSACTALAQSLYTLSDDEAATIGWALAFRIASAQKLVIAGRLSRLALPNVSGCCSHCDANYVRGAQVSVTSLLTGEPPANVVQKGEGYWDVLCAELKTRCPNVGACGNQQCLPWPTVEKVKSWIDCEKERKTVSGLLDFC